MFSQKQFTILSLLLIIGAVIAIKLLNIEYMVNYSTAPYQSFCNINAVFNCDAVAASAYSHIAGISIALLGSVANLFLLAFLWVARRRELLSTVLRPLYLFIFLLYGFGCLYLATISFFFAPSLCILCICFWTVSWVSLIYLWAIARQYHYLRGWRQLLRSLPPIIEHEWRFLGLALLIFLSALVGGQMLVFGKGVVKDEPVYGKKKGPFLGSPDALLELTFYSDFQCPPCKMAGPYVDRLAQKYGEKLRIVRKDFPLDSACNRLVKKPFHPLACMSAYYAKCAGRQGQFWEFHDLLYNNQETLSADSIQKFVTQVAGLDKELMAHCVSEKKIQEEVALEIEEGLYYKVDSTPAMRLFAETFIPVAKEAALEEYIQNYPEMPFEMFQRYVEKQLFGLVQIVDLRTEKEFQEEHLVKAISWDFENNQQKFPAGLDKNRAVLLYDTDGQLSSVAFKFLREQGFKEMMMLKGGWSELQKRSPHLYADKSDKKENK